MNECIKIRMQLIMIYFQYLYKKKIYGKSHIVLNLFLLMCAASIQKELYLFLKTWIIFGFGFFYIFPLHFLFFSHPLRTFFFFWKKCL